MTLAVSDFDHIRRVVREESGIVLEAGKEYLVEARLAPVLRERNLASYAELAAELRTKPRGPLTVAVVEAMTTNETTFFRDVTPFEVLRTKVLPELFAARPNGPLTLWSAACSSGQEAYSVAMMLRENFDDASRARVEIIGTDIDAKVLARAREGRYSQIEVNRGLPAAYLLRYFAKDGMHWVLREDVRRQVEFRAMNFVGEWRGAPFADVILLRNVLIYFDQPTRQRIVSRMERQLNRGGYLMLGSTESLQDVDTRFDRVELGRGVVYRLPG